MEALLGICVGVGLAAACGFRVFVPLLVVGIAGRSGHLTLAENLEWMQSMPAIVAFGTATALEIAAYYVPWIDNMMDSLASPVAVVAGTIASASVITGMDPMLQWTIALLAGGGTAAGVQMATVTTRAASSLTTGGVGNPVVSTAEAGAATGLSLLMVLLPALLAAALVVAAGVIVVRFLVTWRHRRAGSYAVVAGAKPE